MYGYGLGNRVLQQFGRYIMEQVGARNSTYRLDGTKFAVITEKYAFEEVKKIYDQSKAYFREGLDIDGTFITLELNASTLVLDDYDTDDQTVYACLNFAYSESKNDKNGELVEFRNGFRNDERLKIAQLHEIRNSITKDYRGFYLVYQPVVDADTEELIGAEALLRWKNETQGVVPPDTFVPPCSIWVSYLSGKLSINSCALANLHTRIISSSVASLLPQRRLSLILPANTTFLMVEFPVQRPAIPP